MRGQIVKAVANVFTVELDGKRVRCSVRGIVKRDIDLFVGDYVEVENKIITKVYERKNVMIRPYVSNLDELFIVVAKTPAPDWLLVEKLLLNCHAEGITPVFILNKCELCTEDEIREMTEPYLSEMEIYLVSAEKHIGLEPLKERILGKVVCFAGQSAVGKSSLINAVGEKDLEVGDLSRRIERGKNTTRQVEIFPLLGGRIVDTCGFSMMDAVDIRFDELTYYYDEFVKLQDGCKYQNCTHTTEPDCAVKKAVAEGKLNQKRYERYAALYQLLKENWRKKYD